MFGLSLWTKLPNQCFIVERQIVYCPWFDLASHPQRSDKYQNYIRTVPTSAVCDPTLTSSWKHSSLSLFPTSTLKTMAPQNPYKGKSGGVVSASAPIQIKNCYCVLAGLTFLSERSCLLIWRKLSLRTVVSCCCWVLLSSGTLAFLDPP